MTRWITLWVVMLALVPLPAWATSKANQDMLSKHFATLGNVISATFAPLGGPEIGAAVLAGTGGEGGVVGTPQLLVVRVAGGGKIEQLVKEALPSVLERPQYALLLGGKHLMTYAPVEFRDDQGIRHGRGDLVIRDLEAEGGIKTVYTLRDVEDLLFAAGSVAYNDVLLWQPSPHFLNAMRVLPVRNLYVHLSYDDANKAYKLYQHLTVLPDAAQSDAANLNNRALLYYRYGDLLEASHLLEQASALAEDDQSLIAHNQELIKGELSDLERQVERLGDRESDRALLYFWQGDYNACLRELEGRQSYGLSDTDCAMAGLCLAENKSWPEVDQMTVELEHRKVPFLADYLAEVIHRAIRQGYLDIAQVYLKALQAVRRDHPAAATMQAELLLQAKQNADAQQVLEQFLAAHPGGSVNAEPRMLLYQLYLGRGNTAGCESLKQDALQGPVSNLLGYVLLEDYADLSAALREIQVESDRVKMPNGQLDVFGIN